MADGTRVYLIGGARDQRRSCARLLGEAGYDVTGFSSARAFIEVAPALASGCVLDVRPLEDGEQPSPGVLSAQRPDLPVIVVSDSQGNVELAVRSIKSGAADFLEASCSDARLLEAIASVAETAAAAEGRSREASLAAVRLAEITQREREVLERLLVGGTNKTIAKELGISPRTVEIHRAHVMERLGAHSLPEAVRLALAAGFMPRAPAKRSEETSLGFDRTSRAGPSEG
jgi:FixJ family two-component response regulator